jgi:hypothetical protein
MMAAGQLNAAQKAALLKLKASVREEGLAYFCERTGLHRASVQAVLSDTARESTVLLALDRFSKAKPAA